jgi:pyrroline-5-carboxylate reductase
LRSKVTSKGGTTAAALAVLEKSPGLMGLMQSALTAAHQRAQEMAKDYAA